MASRSRRVPWSHAPLVEGLHSVPGDTAHYLKRVLRLKSGATLELFDGHGACAEAVFTSDNGQPAVHITAVQRAMPVSPTPQVSVAVALPKGERADWLVEKCTELGVDEIVWLQCARSVALPGALDAKMERFRRLAQAAARQAGRHTLPILRPPMAVQDVAHEARDGLKLVAHPHGERMGPWPRALGGLRQARVLLGPEGGFTEEELQAVQGAGYTAWWLNRHILRCETAAVAAATLLSGWAHEMEHA